MKLVATRLVEALGRWDLQGAGAAAAGTRVSALGIDPAFVGSVAALVDGGAAARIGSYNVGGPYLLSGSQYFSDQTHHDHAHAGFSA